MSSFLPSSLVELGVNFQSTWRSPQLTPTSNLILWCSVFWFGISPLGSTTHIWGSKESLPRSVVQMYPLPQAQTPIPVTWSSDPRVIHWKIRRNPGSFKIFTRTSHQKIPKSKGHQELHTLLNRCDPFAPPFRVWLHGECREDSDFKKTYMNLFRVGSSFFWEVELLRKACRLCAAPRTQPALN